MKIIYVVIHSLNIDTKKYYLMNRNNIKLTKTDKHLLGITSSKTANFNDWYLQIVKKGDFIKNYDISGCYVLLPNSFSIWEGIQSYLNTSFRSKDVKNSNYP